MFKFCPHDEVESKVQWRHIIMEGTALLTPGVLSTNVYSGTELKWVAKSASCQGFFPGGTGGPPSGQNFVPPHPTLVLVFGPRLVPPPRQGSSPKIWNLNYIFVSNLTTFKLKSTLKSCISCLILPNFALGGQFWLLLDFFRKSPPLSVFLPVGTHGDQKFWSPPIKNLEKKPCLV